MSFKTHWKGAASAATLSVLVAVSAGCTNTKTVDAFRGPPPAKPATVRVDGDVRLVSLDGEPVDGFAPDSAPSTPPGDVDTFKKPHRNLRIDPGTHTVTVGLARRWMPLTRDTHMALALLTGSVKYTGALYPGSAQSRQIRFDAAPGATYRIRVKVRGDDWTALVTRRKAGEVGEEIGRTAYADGSPATPDAWIESERDREKAARNASTGYEAEAVKPKNAR